MVCCQWRNPGSRPFRSRPAIPVTHVPVILVRLVATPVAAVTPVVAAILVQDVTHATRVADATPVPAILE